MFTITYLLARAAFGSRGLPGWRRQEFENAEGDDYVTELSAQGSPAPQHGPEVYVLPLTKVSLPMAKQPGRSGKPGRRQDPCMPRLGGLSSLGTG
ncbi:serine/threonine-protein kinase LMTK1-like [Cyanistes caeruleus]|uniref:serine/threonine-protein kinase LMTK1-like n=1 Tax=Cyanistes caeruleus TaxID=156563 RepID=UPI000CDA826A|nr:serine/threonine-protein kinase LMTK1-like [Cyanistes caeruleus]